LEFFWICLHAIKMKPIYEYITSLLPCCKTILIVILKIFVRKQFNS
jgi:hypothetical protein